jgi:hypothetical protein
MMSDALSRQGFWGWHICTNMTHTDVLLLGCYKCDYYINLLQNGDRPGQPRQARAAIHRALSACQGLVFRLVV